jgi:DICT domain-containing protein
MKVEKLAEDWDESMVDLRVVKMVERMVETTDQLKAGQLAGQRVYWTAEKKDSKMAVKMAVKMVAVWAEQKAALKGLESVVKTAVKMVDKLVEMKVELRVGSSENLKAEKLVGKKVVELV